MNSLFDTSSPLMQWVWRNSWQASILVIVVLALQWSLRARLAPGWRYALWLLVVLRLALPVSVQSEWSLFNWVRSGDLHRVTDAGAAGPNAPTAAGDFSSGAVQEKPPLKSYREASATSEEATRDHLPRTEGDAEPGPRPRANPHEDGSRSVSSVSHGFAPDAGVAGATIAPSSREGTPPITHSENRAKWGLSLVLPLLWLVGAAGLSGRLLWEYLRLVRVVREAQLLETPALLTVLEECRREMGVRIPCTLWQTGRIGSPALYGVWRPRLLLPSGFVERFTPNEWRHIFLHELAHLRRRDALVNWILASLQVLHWFNPLVWFGFHRMRADRELACDALVLAHTGETHAKAYGRTIVKVLENIAATPSLPGLVGLLEDKTQVARRIRMIARYKAGPRWSWRFGVFAAALGVVCLSDAVTPDAATTEKGPAPSASLPIVEDEFSQPKTGDDLYGDSLASENDTNRLYLTANVIEAGTRVPQLDKAIAGAKVEVTLSFDNFTFKEIAGKTDQDGLYKLAIPGKANKLREIIVKSDHAEYVRKSVTLHRIDSNQAVTDHSRPWPPTQVTIELETGGPIGGRIRDEQGRPVGGAQVYVVDITGPGRGWYENYCYYRERPCYERSFDKWGNSRGPVAVTDSAGRWSYAHFPRETIWAQFEVRRPDGARESFATLRSFPDDEFYELSFFQKEAGPVDLNDLRQGKADFVLSEGVNVAGRVVNSAGKPVSGALIKESFGQIPNAGTYRADAQGRFVLAHRLPGEIRLSTSANGFGTMSKTLPVRAPMGEVTLVLPEMRPLRVKVVDMEGNPISGAILREQGYARNSFEWTGKTGADGRVAWSNAPLQEVNLLVAAPGYRELRASLIGGQPEQILTLGKKSFTGLMYWIYVEDADTHQPVEQFSVYRFSDLDGSNKLIDGAHGQVHFYLNDTYSRRPIDAFRFTAEGYESANSARYLYDRDQLFRVALRKGQSIQGVVLSPENQPLAGVEIRMSLQEGGLLTASADAPRGIETYRSDAEGRYSIPPARGDKPVIFLHEQGVCISSVEALRRSPEVRLQRWGRIQGQFKIGKRAADFEEIMLANLDSSHHLPCSVSEFTRTDWDGQFHFEKVPPGEYVLHRGTKSEARSTGFSFLIHCNLSPMPVVVVSGQTTQVTFGGSGRRVVGRIVSEPANKKIVWANDLQLLELQLPEPVGPSWNEYGEPEAYKAARERFNNSEEKLRYDREKRTYQLIVDQQGAFRIEDVPPGTYWLKIRSSKWYYLFQAETVASLKQEVIIPKADAGHEDEPVDLGVITVPCPGEE